MLNKIQSLYNNLSAQKLILLFTLISAFISWQIIYIQHGWVNNDFVIYHEAARLFTLQEWKQGFAVFGWPFYSLLVATVKQMSGLDIFNSAKLLAIVFFAITTYSFLTLIHISSSNKTAIACGALVLFGSSYIVGDVLPMMLRDPGFWAFFTLSLVFFIRFYKFGNAFNAVYWQLCAIMAALFRIEGIAYLIGLPLLLIFASHLNITLRLRQYLIANSFSLIAIMSIKVATMISNDISMQNFGRLKEIFTPTLYQELTNKFFTNTDIMANQVLGNYLNEFAAQGLLITFAYVLVIKAISTTGLINFGLAFFAAKSKNNLVDRASLHIFIATVAIAVINSALIITKVFVLSSRYVVPLAFVLMVIASIYLSHLITYTTRDSRQKKLNARKKWLAIAVLIILSLSLIRNILPKSEGYNYQQDAVEWLNVHNDSNDPVFYEDSRLRYFANAPFMGSDIYNWELLAAENKINSDNDYTYLVINHSPEKEALIAEKLPEYHAINRFSSSNNIKSIIIYLKK